MAITYPKIDTLFVRDMDTFKVTDEIRHPEHKLIREWHLTEKIDGTNMRIIIDKDGCGIGGRTDKAQIYPKLQEAIESLYPQVQDWYNNHFAEEDDARCILFGEGYGAKIQSGGGYRDDQGFRLFDVWVGGPDSGKFLDWDNVEEVSKETGITTVPVLAPIEWNYLTSSAAAKTALPRESSTANEDGGSGVVPEGVVARTVPYLYNWKGHRIMWKLKGKDY